MATVLIVDDDEMQRTLGGHFLAKTLGIKAETACSGGQALARLDDRTKPPVDLVLLDLFMPAPDGRATLKTLRARYPALPVIMLTASEALEDAVSLMREGACDFITKPFDPERLRLSVEQHLTVRGLKRDAARYPRHERGQGNFDDLIGARTGLADAVALGRKAALSEIPVLISGESGTGKELLARAIHGESARAYRPFIAINCGAIPETLVESTLFGHEKGSFTGAIARELGKFREAEGGTLLLDEVGELTPEMQTRLLRALQEREIEPVGAGKPVRVDVRIISATHRNLAGDVATGRFREDLFYRLNVLPICLPPLKMRSDDIPAIARHALTRIGEWEHKSPPSISGAGFDWLKAQSWTGNVRELENLLHRAVVISDKQELNDTDFRVLTQPLPGPARSIAHEPHIALLDEAGRPRTWDEIEAHLIAWAMKRCSGEVSKAAKLLSMGQSTLYKKISAKSAPYN